MAHTAASWSIAGTVDNQSAPNLLPVFIYAIPFPWYWSAATALYLVQISSYVGPSFCFSNKPGARIQLTFSSLLSSHLPAHDYLPAATPAHIGLQTN